MKRKYKTRLESLIEDRKSFVIGEEDHDKIYLEDIEALEYAIREIENLEEALEKIELMILEDENY